MKKLDIRWIVRIVLIAVAVSSVFTFVSNEMLSGAGYALAFVALAVFILIGILFDLIGVAVTAAREAPFHAMSSHKERGAKEAIKLIRNADKVSSICNDVVGDISGIVSGTTAALVVERLTNRFQTSELLLTLTVSGLVTALMIGGKAAGKSLAIKKTNTIVLEVGRIVSIFTRIGKK